MNDVLVYCPLNELFTSLVVNYTPNEYFSIFDLDILPLLNVLRVLVSKYSSRGFKSIVIGMETFVNDKLNYLKAKIMYKLITLLVIWTWSSDGGKVVIVRIKRLILVTKWLI